MRPKQELFENKRSTTEKQRIRRKQDPIKTPTTPALDGFHEFCTSCPDGAGNVVLLLHGSAAACMRGISTKGVSRRLSGGAFGLAAYFAEDAGKTDQYTTPLHRSSGSFDDDPAFEASCHEQLIEMLYTDCNWPHPDPTEEIFLLAVCEVVLGFPLHTRDGRSTIAADGIAGQALFEPDAPPTKLAAIDEVNYHSLVVERGEAVKRFREFVCFADHATLLRYIIAYRRV
eukprot:5319727-Amphidinium_carterae.1